MNYRVWTPREWPPTPITLDETVVYGGYPEERRTVPPGVNPKALTVEFVSFLGRPNSCTAEIELSAFIHEGRWDIGVIFARQGCLVTASGELAPAPPGVRQRTLRRHSNGPTKHCDGAAVAH